MFRVSSTVSGCVDRCISLLIDLAARLQSRLLAELDSKKLLHWNRSLPVGDLLNDRWRRAERLGFGQGSSVYDSSIIIGDVSVGANTWVGPFTILDGSGGLRIGSHCSISAGVHIYSHDSLQFAKSGGQTPLEQAPVSIGDNCYIGPNTVITRGVTIGNGAIVGACSFVNEDVEAGQRVYGVPARPTNS
jgi:acetyltransferase-like isoleucine patch superfamily enzyme